MGKRSTVKITERTLEKPRKHYTAEEKSRHPEAAFMDKEPFVAV